MYNIVREALSLFNPFKITNYEITSVIQKMTFVIFHYIGKCDIIYLEVKGYEAINDSCVE